MVSEKNPNVNSFKKPRHLTYQKHVNYLPWTHTSVTQFILSINFLMYVTNIQHLICSRKDSKKRNLQFIFKTHTCDLETFNVIKPTMKMQTPCKVIIMQSLIDFALTVSEKKATLKVLFYLFIYFTWGNTSIISLEYVQKKKRKEKKRRYIHDLLDVINNCTKFQVNWIRTSNFQFKLLNTAVTLKYNRNDK